MRRIATFPVLTALSLAVAACSIQAPGATAPSLEPTPSAMAITTPEPTVDAAAEISRIMELRLDWGLRSDEAWVRQVANDPQAVDSALGIPLMPEEAAELEAMFGDDPRSRLIVYGSSQPDQFAGAFVDGHGVGPFVMLFTADLERHRAALEALPGDFPFEVRLARWTELELKSLMNQLATEIQSLDGVQLLSVSLDTIGNVVTAEFKTNDPSIGARLEAEHPGMLVATSYPLPGPWQNTDSGEGWRLLAAGSKRGDEAYTVRVATSEDEWQSMWATLDPVNPRPEVDLTSEVAISFAEGIGSTCTELRLDDVVINRGTGIVYSKTSDPLSPRTCTADLAGAAFFVIAASRESLPDSPFKVRLREMLVCQGGGCGNHEEITVDLRP